LTHEQAQVLHQQLLEMQSNGELNEEQLG